MSKVIGAVLFVAMFVLIAITLWQITCRFILYIPVQWSEEVVRLAFVWLIFLGSAMACKEGAHLVLDVVSQHFCPKNRSRLQTLVLVAMLVIEAAIFHASLQYVLRCFGKTLVTLPIPSNFMYMSGPISVALMIFFTIEILYEKHGKKGAP
ncbi:MAG: TRAP transporter small permease [Candidatus Accumulibacter sp.]|nr:TRAP transporter small permease [Accumulibacter sp.]